MAIMTQDPFQENGTPSKEERRSVFSPQEIFSAQVREWKMAKDMGGQEYYNLLFE